MSIIVLSCEQFFCTQFPPKTHARPNLARSPPGTRGITILLLREADCGAIMKGGTSLLVETIKDATIVTFQDAALLETIRIQNTGTALFDLVDRQNRLRIVLDFHNVRSLSSSMLGVLLTLKNKLEDAGGRMVLCGLARDLRRLFEMTALDRVFQFAPDADQALAALGVSAAG